MQAGLKGAVYVNGDSQAEFSEETPIMASSRERVWLHPSPGSPPECSAFPPSLHSLSCRRSLDSIPSWRPGSSKSLIYWPSTTVQLRLLFGLPYQNAAVLIAQTSFLLQHYIRIIIMQLLLLLSMITSHCRLRSLLYHLQLMTPFPIPACQTHQLERVPSASKPKTRLRAPASSGIYVPPPGYPLRNRI